MVPPIGKHWSEGVDGDVGDGGGGQGTIWHSTALPTAPATTRAFHPT
jgi:hypothetical protein